MDVDALRQLVMSRLGEAFGELDDAADEVSHATVDLADYLMLKEAVNTEQIDASAPYAALLRYLAKKGEEKAVLDYAKAAFLSSEETHDLVGIIGNKEGTLTTTPSNDNLSLAEARAIALATVEPDSVEEFLRVYVNSQGHELIRSLYWSRLPATGIDVPVLSSDAMSASVDVFQVVRQWHAQNGNAQHAAIAETSIVLAEFFRDLRPPDLTDDRRRAFRLLEREETWRQLQQDSSVPLALYQVGVSAVVLAGQPRLTDVDRRWLLSFARTMMQRAIDHDGDMIILAPQLAFVAFLEASLDKDENPQAFDRARELAAELAARASLIENVDLRLPVLSTLLWFAPAVDLQEGRYEAAINACLTAKAMTVQWHQHVAKQLAEFEAELDEMEGETDTDDEDREELNRLRRLFAVAAAAPIVQELSCDLVALVARGELARKAGNLSEAATYYDRAATLQREFVNRTAELLEVLLPNLASAMRDGARDVSNEVMALHLRAMVGFSRADEALVQGRASDAATILEQADAFLIEADTALTALLTELASNTDSANNADAAAENAKGQKLLALQRDNQGRRRYADAKRSLAKAAQLSALRRHDDAALEYQSVSVAFDELSSDDLLRLPEKLAHVLAASGEFALACFEVELWLADVHRSGEADFARLDFGLRRFANAATMFDRAGETYWAGFIRAFRHEYEALAYELPTPSRIDVGEARHRCLAAAKLAREAYIGLGLSQRERALTAWIREMEQGEAHSFTAPAGPLPLPAPPASFVQAGNLPTEWRRLDVDIETKINRLKKAQARLGALQRRLADLKERRDSGRLDDGRYTDLSASLETEMFSLLQEVKVVLQGDPDLGTVVADMSTVEGSEADRQGLEQVVQEAEPGMFEQMRRGGKLLLELVIETGIRVLTTRLG